MTEHMKNEEELRGQAEQVMVTIVGLVIIHLQLIETVETAVGDVEGLHSKLDRKSSVETSNKERVTQFSEVRTEKRYIDSYCLYRVIVKIH